METMDNQKATEMFNEIQDLAISIQSFGKHDIPLLSGLVQNPDFVNEDNVQEQYEIFKGACCRCAAKLAIYQEAFVVLGLRANALCNQILR